tara:strand:- start:1229 stop:1810 length:582 start_codon:yes stop_codon:yes gene_type:complete
MCVGAALFGTSKIAGGLSAATAFNIGLGLTAANAFIGRAAAQQRANQTYNQALLANQSAEDDKRRQQQALAEQKQAKEKAEAQNIFAKNIETLQASRAIIASEQAGTTLGLLLMDTERQGANYRESVAQSLESFRRQYDRNILATEATFKNRRNQLQSNINEAYNAIPSLGQTLLSIGASGFNTYTGITAGLR